MKIVMINDCAFVGKTLLKYLPSNIGKQSIERTRGLWSKTVKLAYKIWRAEGDLYHVHYLLQDCYVASRLGKKPLIGHAHGSDLRSTLNHPLWGKLVKHNLLHCNKIVVSTPDILDIANRFREDAEYLPNPVDMKLFYPKPFIPLRAKKHVLIASVSNWSVKGTDIIIRALSRIKDEVEVSIINYGRDFAKTISLASSLGLNLNVLPKVSHERVREYYWNSDVVIDGVKLGSLGVVSLEAIACGRPVIVYASSDYPQYKSFPLRDVNTEEEIVNAVRDITVKLWEKEYAYLKENHSPEGTIQKLLNIYQSVL
ncbi:glycosyltransferase [Candidatus Bathyarchaeota archaeon]|nr:glycosyltransferase [Candidatus Bathyarchaeota archaeon]MBS7613909.1 glycosyltransferase [Candidatus Bathyarchaeota archaeon]MBS7617892.1 glycosyltransferase [Candidatus Bathyarchaeota archaeon]